MNMRPIDQSSLVLVPIQANTGQRKPAHDLSRGCNADDVFNVTAVTVVQVQNGALCPRTPYCATDSRAPRPLRAAK
jgi:hypothetical protein